MKRLIKFFRTLPELWFMAGTKSTISSLLDHNHALIQERKKDHAEWLRVLDDPASYGPDTMKGRLLRYVLTDADELQKNAVTAMVKDGFDIDCKPTASTMCFTFSDLSGLDIGSTGDPSTPSTK